MKHISAVDVFLLRCFDVLMEERSVSRAAETLEISQPALSRALARLRRLFGDPLLIRAQGRMVPTDRALEVESSVRKILSDLEQVINAPGEFDPKTAQATFRLTAAGSVEHLILPRLVERLQNSAPGIRIEVRQPSRDNALKWLETGEIDFRLGWVSRPPETLRSSLLYRDRLICLVRQGHQNVNGHITLEQYLSLPHARLEVLPHGMSGRVIDEVVALFGKKLHIGLLVQNYLTVLDAVARSDLIATIPERLAKNFAQQLSLQILDPPLKLPDFRIAVFWHERSHKNPRHRWFRDQITAVARAL